MAQSSIFFNNHSQAVRLPAEMRFPDSVKKVAVRKVGNNRVIKANLEEKTGNTHQF